MSNLAPILRLLSNIKQQFLDRRPRVTYLVSHPPLGFSSTPRSRNITAPTSPR